MLGVPLLGATVALAANRHPLTLVPLAVALALLLAVYVFFNEEVRLDLDTRVLKLSRRRLLFGMGLSPRVDWEIPVSALSHAKEVRQRIPGRKGGWRHVVVLHLPEGRTLDARELGGGQDKSSAYNQFVGVLEQRLGSGFERPPEVV